MNFHHLPMKNFPLKYFFVSFILSPVHGVSLQRSPVHSFSLMSRASLGTLHLLGRSWPEIIYPSYPLLAHVRTPRYLLSPTP